METKEQNLNQISDALFQKFVSEEIMTRSDLNRSLDAIMEKHTKHIDAKFDLMDNKIDALRIDVDKRFEQVDKRFEQVDRQFSRIDIRYNWIIGTVLSVGVALAGVMFGCVSFLSKLH